MDTSTDAVVADVREKRLAIDRRLELLRRRLTHFSPSHYPWQTWSVGALPVIVMGLVLMMWRRRRYRYRGINWA